MISFRTLCGSSLVALLGAAALALLPSTALAVGGQHTTLASFQANIRANSILEPFNEPDDTALPSIAFSGNGFQATLDSENPSFGVFRLSSVGAGSASPVEGTKFTFAGRPVSAFGGTFRVVNGGAVSIGGFLPTVTGNVDISTCGANFDTILRVFDTCASATHIVCNDDACTGGPSVGNTLASRVQFRCQAGEDYLIRISGFDGESGSGNLTFSVVPDCAADFNHSGGPQTVQDIFDFLAAYFGGC